MSIKVTTYNCQSVNYDIIKILIRDFDILLLQGTLLSDNNQYILNSIIDYFNHAHAVRKASTFVGRAGGGSAILWRKCNNMKIYPLYFTDRIMGLKEASYLIIKVYCIYYYDTTESWVEYNIILFLIYI